MATFTVIPEKTQTATAMKRVIDYVMQEKKTLCNGIKLVSGQNCVPESAYQEFMATNRQYSKAKGVSMCNRLNRVAMQHRRCFLSDIQVFFESEEGQWEQNNIKQD